jgi:hypothetical protein
VLGPCPPGSFEPHSLLLCHGDVLLTDTKLRESLSEAGIASDFGVSGWDWGGGWCFEVDYMVTSGIQSRQAPKLAVTREKPRTLR